MPIMDEATQQHLAALYKAIDTALSGRPVPTLPERFADGPTECGRLHDAVRRFLAAYATTRDSALALAAGRLDIDIPGDCGLAAPFKQLQADLLHLTWQIKQVAAGDLEQHVSFAGEFSTALNAMIESLRQKKRTDEENLRNKRLFQTIFDTSPDGMAITDCQANVRQASKSFRALFHLPEAGDFADINILACILDAEQRAKADRKLDALLAGAPPHPDTYLVRRPDGGSFWLESNASVLHDATDAPCGLLFVVRDVTDRKETEDQLRRYAGKMGDLNEQLRRLTTIDPLTGAYNRRLFDERMETELSRYELTGHDVCLAMFDLDCFKDFNDTYGHAAGDAALIALVRQVETSIRKTDMLFRYGGEEFTILLPDTSLVGALKLTERIRADIETLAIANPHGQPWHITASFGLAGTEEGVSTASELIEAADKALYLAKRCGRNCVRTCY